MKRAQEEAEAKAKADAERPPEPAPGKEQDGRISFHLLSSYAAMTPTLNSHAPSSPLLNAPSTAAEARHTRKQVRRGQGRV